MSKRSQLAVRYLDSEDDQPFSRLPAKVKRVVRGYNRLTPEEKQLADTFLESPSLDQLRRTAGQLFCTSREKTSELKKVHETSQQQMSELKKEHEETHRRSHSHPKNQMRDADIVHRRDIQKQSFGEICRDLNRKPESEARRKPRPKLTPDGARKAYKRAKAKERRIPPSKHQ
jgi:hypothetical protein